MNALRGSVLAVASIFLIFLNAGIHCKSIKDQTVTYEDVKNIRPGTYLIDVREPDEIKETGLIPGSINIPMAIVQKELTPDSDGEEFLQKYGLEKPGKDSEIIFTCRSGIRAKKIMKMIDKLGYYTNLKYYPGSWLEWESKSKQEQKQ